ncbi:hypothetical protein [Neobacillus vireti]|uniref:DUF2325 domain-containing protein n=1 Tax=Neobacillus vireti LMG 21834 TaxID=1131730 RepID=A0AB94ISB6_9BACI|nr:hypothetical protein [Neobacillus vireti]ETI69979.1 hypothetical protein BAVI_04759 [Neobacillus vireti LMG 21834]KLT15147.1 hypothetical protein AA980_25055 [Neobacillus vireti]
MLNQIDSPLQEQEILYPFLCIALGGNSYLHPTIDDFYRKNEWEYYEAYQRSEWNGNPLFSMYSTKSEEKIRQVAGILEWCCQNQQFHQLDQLIKKGYKYVYQYLQHHTEIDLEHFIRSFAKRQKNKMVKEIDLIYQNIVLWYLSDRQNKPINKRNIAWKSFHKVLFSSFNENNMQKALFSKSTIEQNREEINQLYEKYDIPKNHRFDSLGYFIEYLISANIKRMYEANPNCSTDTAEHQVFQNSPCKYIGALGGWLKTLKIHELDATEQIPLSKTDLDMVLLGVLYAKKYNYINKEEQDLFFITCLYLKCLGSHFLETKQLFLDQSKQDYYLEMKTKESQLKDQEEDLIRRQQSWQFTNRRQQKEIEGLTEELREAQSRIRLLEEKIERMEDYSDEVHALRNYVYSEEHEEPIADKQPSFINMKEFIESKRIVIFGGFPNWRQKLKDLLETIEFVDADEMNRDISKVQRADAVFINTTVFGHAFYRKIMKELNKSETPLFYLKGKSNIESTTLEIYKCLTQ